MQTFDATQTRQALPFDRLVAALDAMFAEGCEVPLRHTHRIAGGAPGERGGTVLIMPAWRPGRYLGIKTVSIYPDNASRGLPGLHAVYLLLDAATGVPLALIDGNEITARRTAAASALAGRFLARADARRLLVVGSGRVARLLPEAWRAVRPVDQVTVWSRTPAHSADLAAQWRAQGWQARAAADLGAAVAEADIVSCATLSEAPLIEGRWLRPGTHLDLIGGFTPAMRESDDECLRRARVFVDTDEALMKAGDLLAPIASGAFRAHDLQATLAQLCRGERAGREREADITFFKSVGNALEDLAAAILVFEAA